MDECSKALSKTRKKRVVSATLAPPEAVAELSLLAAQPLHKTSKVPQSFVCSSPDGAHNRTARHIPTSRPA